MLLQPDKIVLVHSADEELDVGEVAIPSGSIVHFDTDKGWFRFVHENGNLQPRCKDDHLLDGLLKEAVRQTPGAGSAHYNIVRWMASCRLTDRDRIIIRSDRFATWSELSVFALGIAGEVILGSIHKMRVFTP